MPRGGRRGREVSRFSGPSEFQHAQDGNSVLVRVLFVRENSYRLRLDRASHAGLLMSLTGGRLRRLQTFDRPAFGNDPPLRLPAGDEEDLRRAEFCETIGQSIILHPNSVFAETLPPGMR
jgi:hypothetical protein